MVATSYIMTEDETFGDVYSATISTGDDYYICTMFSTEETDVNVIEYGSVTALFGGMGETEVSDVKVGELDAVATCMPTMNLGMVSWIDAENGLFYRVEAMYMAIDDAEAVYTPDSMAELAVSLMQ